MKKTSLLYSLMAVIAAFTLAACQKETPAQTKEDEKEESKEIPIPEEDLHHVTFTATNEEILAAEDEDTKVYFSNIGGTEEFGQSWKDGDQVAVYSKNSTAKTTLTVYNVNGYATFDGTVGNAPYRAMYPAAAATSVNSTDGTVITGTLPSEQTLSDHGTDPNALVAVAYATSGTTLKFYNVFGLIRFTLTETDVTSIIIEGNNSEKLAGTFTVDVNSTAPACTVTEGATSIVLKPSGDTFEAGTYAAAVFPQIFSKGIKIIYKHSGDEKCSIKTINANSNLEISRNTIRYYSHDKLAPGEYKYYYILTKADLNAWNGDSANWASTDVVYLGADIDYGKATFTKSKDTFSGTFDGRKHRVYNLSAEGSGQRAGLFHNVTGTIKNLCVGSSDYDFSKGSAADAGTYDGYSFFKITGCMNADSWYYAGGVVAYLAAGGKMENVVNFCTVGCQVTASTHQISKQRAGGIAGTMKGNTTIQNCTNYGTIEFTSTVIQNGLNDVGGIVSHGDGSGAKVQNCVNRGNIHCTSPELQFVGGIIGGEGASMTIDKCRNYGSVTKEGTATSNMNTCIAGIIGYSCSAISGGDSLENYGNITYSGAGTTSVCIGGIIGRCVTTDFSLTSAKNEGEIKNTGSMTCDIHMGGIAGFYNCESEYDGVSNSGNVINEGACGNLYIGGIIGNTQNDNGITIKNCSNIGNITNTANVSGNFIRQGGIAGYAEKITITSSSNGKESQNTGAITNSGNAPWVFLGGLVGHSSKGNDSYSSYITSKNYGAVSNTGTASNSGQGLRMGGLVGYTDARNDIGKTDSNKCINKGDVSNTSNSPNPCIGGIIGHSASARSYIQYSENYGNISCASTGTLTEVRIGGIAGSSHQPTNMESAKNRGSVTNSANTTKASVGGICGYSNNNVVYSSSITSGNIENNGSVDSLFIGGISGYLSSSSATMTPNTSNSGKISAGGTLGVVYIGGAFGKQNSSTEKVKATNSGDVETTAATSGDLYISGIVANASGEVTNCSNSGAITIGGNVGGTLYCGGVCGWNAGNTAMSSCTNDTGGNISMASGKIAGLMYCGGVLGSEATGKTLTHTDFINRGNIQFGSNANEDSKKINTDNQGWSCIGGCVGGIDSDGINNTYNNMTNSGSVTYHGDHKVEMGGCVGCAAYVSGTLRNTGNLTYKKRPTKGNAYLGGIVGWLEKTTTLSGAVCIAKVDSYDCASRARTGGIVGGGKAGTLTCLDGCKYKGDLRGTSSGASAGLMCTAGSNNQTISFVNCVVGTGTRWYNNGSGSNAWMTVTELVLNYVKNTAGKAALCGSGTSDTDGTSDGTMTGCTIGTVE